MNIIILQEGKLSSEWLLTYNSRYIRGFESLNLALGWLARNPEGWAGHVTVNIIGTLNGVVGGE